MGLTVTYKPDPQLLQKIGHGYQFRVGAVTFDSSYPTGGETLDLSKLIPVTLEFLFALPASGYFFEYDLTNKKLKAYYFDYDAGADGAAIEVANTTDLSAVSTTFFAVGR